MCAAAEYPLFSNHPVRHDGNEWRGTVRWRSRQLRYTSHHVGRFVRPPSSSPVDQPSPVLRRSWRELARVKMHAGIFALGSRPYSLLG